MSQNYHPPLEEIRFLLKDFFKLEEVLDLASPGVGPEVADAVLEEAAKFATNELLPLNHVGDKVGCKFKDGAVTTPPGFKEAYKKFVESGWNSVASSPEYGGQGLPYLVSMAISEMWNGANMAFTLCPLLTQGAVESISHHGSKEQKDKYLAKLISGEWTGTMCLTEPQAGSDLAAIRTKAVKNGDHYLIKGQKIFITYGEHDYTDNIIHMVLARTPDAPEGVKGISLFIVPKNLEHKNIEHKNSNVPNSKFPVPASNRNDVYAISIEHKLGIHASPTAVMSFGDAGQGAVGYLVGKENEGLKYMFTMMNSARIAVGVEGLGISESSYQQALAYAKERVQGVPQMAGRGLYPRPNVHASGSVLHERKDGGATPVLPSAVGPGAIINHPDVYRTLLTIRAHTEACRLIIYYVARSIDLSRHHTDEKTRQLHQDIVDLLTPVAKAHATELGFSNSSLAVQVFGGLGYIEETGIAQNLRDARIAMIYEGTNGIQAMDLVFRKLTLHDGRLVESFFLALPCSETDQQGASADRLTPDLPQDRYAADILKYTTKTMQSLVKENPAQAAFLASQYLRLFGIALGGMLLNESLEVAKNTQGLSAEFIKQKQETVEFYNQYILPEVEFLAGCLS